jgi:hypothetical protein
MVMVVKFLMSTASGQKDGRSDRKRNFVVLNRYWVVGAVLNRDYPDNRGWKPLPPTIHYSLKNTDFYVVSHERCDGLDR